jgi:hypothetical protein
MDRPDEGVDRGSRGLAAEARFDGDAGEVSTDRLTADRSAGVIDERSEWGERLNGREQYRA